MMAFKFCFILKQPNVFFKCNFTQKPISKVDS